MPISFTASGKSSASTMEKGTERKMMTMAFVTPTASHSPQSRTKTAVLRRNSMAGESVAKIKNAL